MVAGTTMAAAAAAVDIGLAATATGLPAVAAGLAATTGAAGFAAATGVADGFAGGGAATATLLDNNAPIMTFRNIADPIMLRRSIKVPGVQWFRRRFLP